MTAASLQTSLERVLTGNPASKVSAATPKFDDETPQTGVYGDSLYARVTTPNSGSPIRLVEIGFDIECGQDRVLLAYEPGIEGWRRTLLWQSPEYSDVSGAFGDFFQYGVIASLPWKIAVAHGTNWCTSRWSGFKIDVLTPTAAAPRVVWHTEQGYVRESDPRLVTRADGFELRADVGTIETEQMTRKGVFRYKVSGDTVERVQPIAVDGRGFVDAWLQAPWSEAKRWSVAEGAAGFEKVHEAFARGRKDASVTYSYGPVRACSVKGRYEVEIDAEPGGPQFYAIEQGQNGYTMVNFGTTQDERCGGVDLMKKR